MVEKRTILVTGGSGFVGWNLLHAMLGRNHSPVALTNHTSLNINNLDAIHEDLTQTDAVQRAIDPISPDVVIHCAAMTQAGACEKEPEKAEAVNINGTLNLLKAVSENTRFIFLSTDLVFDGKKGNYSETDVPNPLSAYSRTKYDAEGHVRELCNHHVILRSALVYGPAAPHYDCFLGWMHQGFRNGKVTLFADEYRTPIFVSDLAVLIIRLIDSDFVGTLHVGGPERLSRVDFGKRFCEVFGYSPAAIASRKLSDNPSPVYRPPDVSLDITLASKELGFTPLSVREGLIKTRDNTD